MNSLVAYGSGSDISDSDEEDSGTPNNAQEKITKDDENKSVQEKKEDLISDEDEAPNSNFLFSNEDEEEKKVDEACSKSETETDTSNKLPNPLASQSGPDESVFVSHYTKKEQEKLSVLEKHVKVSEDTSTAATINGVKVCWMYRKGKCKKGHRCQFAHDNDLVLKEDKTAEKPDSVTGGQGFTLGQGFFRPDWQGGQVEQPDDDSYMANMKRKKRHGVRDTLVPPKKAYQELAKQREVQRPWTVKK